jgi:hypothetical protein
VVYNSLIILNVQSVTPVLATGSSLISHLPPAHASLATQPMRRQRAPEAQSLASAIMAFLYALAKVLWPMFVVFAAVRLYKNGPEHSLTTLQTIISPVTDHTAISPHAASWRSWFHPSQIQLGRSPGPSKKDWNILHHLGGNGPWVEMSENGGKTPDLTPLPGCSIDQVHMV